MILFVCAVYDRALEAYNRPLFVPHKGAALRSFTDEALRVADDNTLNKHPEDYELFCFGTFDDTTGVFQCGAPERLVRAKDIVQSSSK